MLGISLQAYSLLADMLDADLIVATTSNLAPQVRHVCYPISEVAVVSEKLRPVSASDPLYVYSLWNSYKFEVLAELSGKYESLIIGDFDIVFNSSFINRVKPMIDDDSLSTKYLCFEDTFDDNARSTNPSYSYLTRVFNLHPNVDRPANAGLIVTTDPKKLVELFFSAYEKIVSTYGLRYLRLKRYFIEGAIEQVLIPSVLHTESQFAVLDGGTECINPYNRVDIVHLLGAFKTDQAALRRFRNFLVV
jgi:hypothetical protein